MPIDSACRERLRAHLARLFPGDADEILADLQRRIDDATAAIPLRRTSWDQTDAVLITYGDQVSQRDEAPLETQRRVLVERGLGDVLSTVHILPFFPYSSDDGFSVIDYRQVDPALGDWSHVASLGQDFELMFDLVVNHCSRHSEWFRKYVAGDEPYASYFIEVDPDEDVSLVTRPRSHPLLTAVETSRGTRHVWTTFSDDQIDLNFASPSMLAEIVDILLFYLQQGARIVRLDAIAYLWKELGTSCIHLPQTHEVVKLMRAIVDAVAPGTILLTETNVPHEENVSYYGDGDEAQMVYQFSLGPLLAEALQSGDATVLNGWLSDLEPTPSGTTVFNFTASHDGIGVRPLEGIMPADRFEQFIDAVRLRGGHVSMKRNTDGTESPYELNITYFDAVSDPDATDPGDQVRRFLAGQAVMLSLKGIPGIYFHSLVGTPNNHKGVEETGRARTINRKKFQRDELDTILDRENSPPAQVLEGYRRMLAIRREQPAFHPDASQEVIQTDAPALVVLVRESSDPAQKLLVLANLGPQPLPVHVEGLIGIQWKRDLLGQCEPGTAVTLAPHQVAWLDI
jgi:glucosylglycerate phosphorylase